MILAIGYRKYCYNLTDMDVPKLIFLLFFSLASSTYAEAPKDYPFVSFDQGFKQAQQSNKIIFLYFGRYGCGWCDKTNAVTFSQEKIKKLFTHNYELVYVDAESGKRITLPSELCIKSRLSYALMGLFPLIVLILYLLYLKC